MLPLVMGVLSLLSCAFWIYVFVNFRDEEMHPKAKQSFASQPGFIQVNGIHGPRSGHVIVLRRAAVPSKRAKSA